MNTRVDTPAGVVLMEAVSVLLTDELPEVPPQERKPRATKQQHPGPTFITTPEVRPHAQARCPPPWLVSVNKTGSGFDFRRICLLPGNAASTSVMSTHRRL